MFFFGQIPPYTKTEDGFELQFGVNHLAHFLMADLLIKNNLINEPGRIVVVSSYGHTFASNGIQFDDLNFEKGYNRIKAYGQSKLANILFAKELTKRMKAQGKDIIAVSLHPGSGKVLLIKISVRMINRHLNIVKTELARHVPAFLAVPIQFLSGFFMKSPYEGAQVRELEMFFFIKLKINYTHTIDYVALRFIARRSRRRILQ
jgi:NAD(P)-dependent dehydrogenase (short-subunit alcohol dehydrogenase family)